MTWLAVGGETRDLLVTPNRYQRLTRKYFLDSELRNRLRQEGKQRFIQLLSEHGGVFSRTVVEVLLEKNANLLVEIELLINDNGEFPVWQFDTKGHVLNDIVYISGLLIDAGYVEKCIFFLTPCDDLNGRTPLEALTMEQVTELDMVKRLAHQYLRQGAK